ncbi:RagB/SusD family nutrient uptake outer membrane protein [Olivibacter sp. SDN3]|uniref:RagB/SusD family nutrient uptake outer membrane protein n=1 Tax=Olivibacter sp. SDN3 TaxID=2764720 RepID=UPI00165124FE|nr:RagB/SusD family nutrient uptake outer membrane protein [Olivibacter sp. SDN3]QNL52247.1 RagB/SusD family nutrient uptake outer membrane protein [Olivibacter sp. SDN3]
MKKVQYFYLSAISLCFLTSSCNLDEVNPSGSTADAIWTSPEGFITAVNGAYVFQRSSLYQKEDGIFAFETGTDLWLPDANSDRSAQITKYASLTPGNTGQLRTIWREAYKGINQCNAGINRIEEAGFTNESEKNARLGELRFLRAFYNWHIVETWGGVDLRTEEVDGPELTAIRSPVNEFYDLIFEDLLFAAEHLPNSHGAEYSRATKKSALGLLARAYLSRAYYPDGGQEFFQRAQEVATAVIERQNEFQVSLWSSPHEIFDPANNRQNKEALYVISNSTNNALNLDDNANRTHSFFHMNYSAKIGLEMSMEYGHDGTRRVMPTRALLDMFDNNYDARYNAFFREIWICNQAYTWTREDAVANGKDPSIIGYTMRPGIDTALYVTKDDVPNKHMLPYTVVDRDSVYNVGNGRVNPGAGVNYPVLQKFMDPTRSSVNSQAGVLDLIVIRLAEMYMIAAEAAFQLGDLAVAVDNINVIRTRAANSETNSLAEMQVSAADITLDFILDERAREFCGEYQRWFDLKRTRTLGDRITRLNPDILNFQEHHYLRPVPQQDIDVLLNGDEFGQNPGY